MSRRKYFVNLTANDQKIKAVIIDSHYEKKHSASMTDELILDLVQLLDDGDFEPESAAGNFEYYVANDLILKNKKYRLIWLIEKSEIYIGVINAYRSK
jgi:hypothetical protein